MNICFLIGNVGRDPEIRNTQGGNMVANFSLATAERWKKDGERQEKTTWHNCIVWGNLVKVVEDYVRKGSKICVAGRYESRKYTTRDGDERVVYELTVDRLELLSERAESRGRDDDDDADQPRSRRAGARGANDEMSLGGDLDDDIPF